MADTIEVTSTEREHPDLDEYRAGARAWMADNLVRREVPLDTRITRNRSDYDPSQQSANRVLQRKMYEAGYAGITWPTEYGGQGLPDIYQAAFYEEAQHFVLPDFGSLSVTTFGVNAPSLLAHGQPEFLREVIPKVMSGDALFCQFFSEPSGGSDMYGARTRATRDGDNWVISGQKTWGTFAHEADWGLCIARTDWDAPKHRGLTWFAIPTSLPGVTIRQIRQLDDTHGGFCETFFDDVVIPDSYRVGDVNDGWTVAQSVLVFERGAGRSGVDLTLDGPGALAPDLVEVARAAGRLDEPVVRQKLARAHMIDYVGRSLSRRVGLSGRAHGFNPGLASYGKLFAGTYNSVRARIGVEIGGVGAMTWKADDREGPRVSNRYLNSRIQAIAGGTNEMQRNGISERTLGMPREISFDSKKPFNEVLSNTKDWAPPKI
jgi:alkylation response protein AidB-like acyl-CoA dehydrogenase